MATFPEVNLKLTAHRWRCVLDPSLALSPHGLALAKRLGGVAQLWLGRDLWHILDSSDYYVDHPELLVENQHAARRLQQVIRDWESVRLQSDLAGLKIHWVGDGLSESVLPDGVDSRLLDGFEALSCSLGRRITSDSPMDSAMRDVAALSAALGDSCILCDVDPEEQGSESPAFCVALERWDIPCRRLQSGDPLAEIEREYLRRLLVQVGAGPLIWAGLQLATIRLLLPRAPQVLAAESVIGKDPLAANPEMEFSACSDLWLSAQAFWQLI